MIGGIPVSDRLFAEQREARRKGGDLSPHQEHQAGEGTREKPTHNHDREGNTLSVCIADPKKEQLCKEADDEVVLVKDEDGRVIGFERLNDLSAA